MKVLTGVVLGAFALSGCSGSHAPAPSVTSSTTLAAPTLSVSKDAPADVAVQLTNATSHVDTHWQAPRYTAQWPSFAAAPALSDALKQQASAWTSDYAKVYAKSTYSDFNVTWQPLANGAYTGVRLIASTLGADASTESVVKYGSGSKVYASLDLIDATQRGALKSEIISRVAKFTGESDLDKDANVFSDVSFGKDGSLQVRIPEGTLTSASQGTLYVTVKNPKVFLSPMGQQIQKSLTDTRVSSQAPVPADDKAVDCKVHKCIALTFDDGPGPYTNSILSTLRDKHAKATFFMLGPAVEAQPDVVRRMHSLGMELGNHSWSHPQFTLLAPDQVNDELNQQAAQVKDATGTSPDVARPPYGAFTPQTPHDGYPFVLWDVDTEDWKNRNSATTTQRALSGAHRGAIILMHDIQPTTAQALPGIIDALQKQGYTLVTVHDLIGAMDKNKAYYSASDAR